jgi:hypothetical protein
LNYVYLAFRLRAKENLTQKPALTARQKGKTAPCVNIWKEKLGHEESASCNRYGVGTLYGCRRQRAEIPHNGADRYMFFSICWLSRQHGAYQPNDWQLAWKVFAWMV